MLKKIWHIGVTKFLGNFNDNAFKTTAIMVAVGSDADQNRAFAVTSLASMLFLLPFVLLPTLAGWMADNFMKRRVLIWMKWLELAIMSVGWLCLWMEPQWGLAPLMVCMVAMAVQSTLFSPAYLGIMPELFEERELSEANGIAELLGFLGIIMGLGAGGAFSQFLPAGTWMQGLPFIGLALVGIGTAMFIPRTSMPASWEPFSVRHMMSYFKELRYLTVSQSILLCAIGTAIFSAIGFMLTTSLFNYGMYTEFTDPWHISHLLPNLAAGDGGSLIRLSETGTATLQLAAAMGIGVGCLVAGIFSGDKVEFGLVPIGAIGMAVFCMHLAFADSYSWALASLFLLGMFGGFFTLPLKVYLQTAPRPEDRGKTLAGANAVDFMAMFVTAAGLLVLTGGLNGETPANADTWTQMRGLMYTFDSHALYRGTLAVLLVLSLYLVWLLPEFLIRMLVFLMTRVFYHLRILNAHRLPRKGPVLLIANHVSTVDGLLLSAATNRPIYFLAHEHFRRQWWLRPFVRWSRMITIPREAGPKATQAALAKVEAKLRAGEIVCVFPEGRITGNGMMGEFKRGFLACLPPDMDVPIVPVHLGLLWGSIFSRRFGQVRVRKPRRLPYPVTINFGDPLPADVTPLGARLAVSELDAESEIAAAADEMTIGQRFIHMCRRRPLAKLWADSSGPHQSNLAMLIKVYVLRRVIRREFAGEYVGLVFPASTGAAALAYAAMIADKVPVFLNFTASETAVNYAVAATKMDRVLTSRVFVEKASLSVRDDFVYIEDLAKTITTADKVIGILQATLLPAALAAHWLFPAHSRDMGSTATILFSSGSTGEPKGVVLSHHNFTGNLNGVARVLGMVPETVILGSLPFFHSFGFMATLCLPMAWGLRVIYHPNPMDASAIGEVVQRERVSMLLATPTFLQAYTRKCTREQFATLRLVITGAEKLRPNIAAAFAEKFGVVPIEGYGTTELSPVVSVNMPRSFDDIGKDIGQPGTVGMPLPGIAARVVDPSTQDVLDVDEEGLLQIKGPNVMVGYLGRPDLTAEVLRDGWYSTGDMAKIDRDGYIAITGRLSRFSKIAGEMVPHLALEDAVHEVLGVHDATHVVISSVEDADRGERIVVLMLAEVTRTPQEIIAGLRGTGMPNLWIPKARDFHIIAHFPMLGSGKLDLAAIKQTAKDLAG